MILVLRQLYGDAIAVLTSPVAAIRYARLEAEDLARDVVRDFRNVQALWRRMRVKAGSLTKKTITTVRGRIAAASDRAQSHAAGIISAVVARLARRLFVRVVDVVSLPHCVGLPDYETDGAAVADVYAAIPEDSNVIVRPGDVAIIPTGISVAVPFGFKLEVLPRWSLAVKLIGVANSPAAVDSDYRGEVKAIVENRSEACFMIARGDRVCQVDLVPVFRMIWNRVKQLSPADPSDGEFGSTGLRR